MDEQEDVIGELKEGIEFAYHRCHCGLAITMEKALKLLKAQEYVSARKLREEHYGRYGFRYEYACGNCHGYLLRTWKACPICGKAVKFDE